MEIPASFVLDSSLEVGRVYYIKAPELIQTDEPHYFIVIGILEDNSYLLVSTTQLDKKIAWVRNRKIPDDTICYIEPSSENELKKDSYLNCNSYHEVKNQFLIQKIESGELVTKGIISDTDFEKIRNSIKQSPLFDIPIELITK
ncbi:hypothetical protein [Sphingobacterium sp.]|uniref:hypothetical protein n=1 Tax=Sphingobacterium sp. TaxID=341027 RepID=UPI0028ABEA87|nr:hypothetical protein [Sphingobacterium sp.]